MLSRCRTFCPALQNNEFLQSYTNHFNLCGKGTLRCRTGIPEDSLRWLRLPDCIKSVWSELLWIGRCCSSVCQQAGVEQDTDLEVLDICSSLRKKKGRIGNSTNQMKASVNLCTGDGYSLAPLLTEYQFLGCFGSCICYCLQVKWGIPEYAFLLKLK